MSDAAVISGITFIPMGSRVIVEKDEFRSGFECKRCGESGKIDCVECSGTGKIRKVISSGGDKACPYCSGGKITCPECKGHGSILAIPETAKRRPITGIIRAIGPLVTKLTVDDIGERVLFAQFAGNEIPIDDPQTRKVKATIIILDENEVAVKIKGFISGLEGMKDFTLGS